VLGGLFCQHRILGFCGFLVTFGFWVLRRLRNAVFLFLFNLEYLYLWFLVTFGFWVLGGYGMLDLMIERRNRR